MRLPVFPELPTTRIGLAAGADFTLDLQILTSNLA